MPSVSLGSSNLCVVAKACNKHPSYLNDLQFEVLAGKLQFWKRMRIYVLVKIPAVWKGEGMPPSDLKQGVNFQNFSAQDTFESPFKMLVAPFSGLLEKQSFKYLLFVLGFFFLNIPKKSKIKI